VFYSRRGIFLLPILLAGCGQAGRTSSAPLSVAVLRGENLSGDPSLEWMGRAFSLVLSGELSFAPGLRVIPLEAIRGMESAGGVRPAAAPGGSAEREAAFAAGADRIVYCDYSSGGGNLRLSARMQDARSLKFVLRVRAQAPIAGGIFPVADAVAKQIHPGAQPFGTRSEAAIHSFAAAFEAPDTETGVQALARAAAADPNFGQAYLVWMQTERGRNPAAAERVLQMARARGNALSAYDRARLDLNAAELHHDIAARLRALSAMAKLGPPDPAVFRGLAEAALQGRRYREAIQAYQQALALAPDDVSMLNVMGYAEAYLGDRDAALETLRRYQRLQPNQANPLDSQGDVNFSFSRFADAEKLYLEAHQKDPNFIGGGALRKAAEARLATGDIAGADEIFERYAGLLAARSAPAANYQRAQWQYLSGRRREALATLDRLAPQAPQLQPQIVFWELALGDRTSALRRTAKVAASPQPPGQLMYTVASLLTQPAATPAEWEARAQRAFAQPGQEALRDQMAAYALIFQRDFRGALPYLRRAYDRAHPNTEEGLPVLLAWAMEETDQWQGVTGLVGPTPVPQAAGPGPLTWLYFPRLFYLRARNFDRLGKHEQALENYRLFLKLAGKDAEIWGDEERARRAVGAGK
jgi:tetratricopeptide (TPR) repeat protein